MLINLSKKDNITQVYVVSFYKCKNTWRLQKKEPAFDRLHFLAAMKWLQKLEIYL